MANFNQAIIKVLASEGGYVNDPTDPGGETNFGICKRDNPTLDIKNLTKVQAVDWYRTNWWLKHNFDKISDDLLATWLFDKAVNVGAVPIIKIIQRRVGTDVDGILGPNTIKMINQWYSSSQLIDLKTDLWAYYENLMKNNPKLEKYRNGWHNRCFQ